MKTKHALGLAALLLAATSCDDRDFIIGEWKVSRTGSGGAGGHRGSGGAGGTGVPDAGGGWITADTPVAGCPAYKTMGQMDAFFAMRCGGDSNVCHSRGAVFGDFKSPEMFKRMVDKESIICTGAKFADSTSWSRSVLWLKSFDPPQCPDGRGAGTVMPSRNDMFNAYELACLEGYLKVISGGR